MTVALQLQSSQNETRRRNAVRFSSHLKPVLRRCHNFPPSVARPGVRNGNVGGAESSHSGHLWIAGILYQRRCDRDRWAECPHDLRHKTWRVGSLALQLRDASRLARAGFETGERSRSRSFQFDANDGPAPRSLSGLEELRPEFPTRNSGLLLDLENANQRHAPVDPVRYRALVYVALPGDIGRPVSVFGENEFEIGLHRVDSFITFNHRQGG